MNRLQRLIAAGVLRRSAIDYTILRDLFSTDASAPLTSPRNCEPGPGTLTIVDTGNKVSTSGGHLLASGKTTTGADPRIVSAAQTRAAGLTFIAKIKNIANGTKQTVGWHNASTDTPGLHAAGFANGTIAIRDTYYFTSITHTLPSYTARVNADYEFAFVLCASGCYVFMRQAIDYPDWVLLWRYYGQINTPLYAGTGIADVDKPFDVSAFRIGKLGSPFNTDYGFATTQMAGARANGDTFSHAANAMIDFTVAALPSSETIDFRFRKQDATNYWQVTIDSTGVLVLNEVVAGTPTARYTSAAGVIANGDVVRIVPSSTTIKIYEGAPTSIATLKTTYASATNFQTATSGVLTSEGTGGAVTDIVCYPLVYTGNMESFINPT